VDPGSEMQRGSRLSGVWDPCCPSKSGFNHNKEGWTSKKKRISITIHAGALMDLTTNRNAGFSGCAASKKLRLNISRY
jgi:hypothetical protein